MAHLLVAAILPAVLALGLLFAVLHYFAPTTALRLTNAFTPRVYLTLALILLAAYAAALACTLYLPVAIDPVEVAVAEISTLWLHHQPIYTTIDAAPRYSLLYGPLCFLPFSAALANFGATITTLKLTIVAFNAILFAALWFAFRRLLPPTETLIALAFIASALMMKAMSTFQIRGDAPLAAAVALGLAAIPLRRRTPSILLFALAFAFAVDIKFTAVFYFLVPLYFLLRRHGAAALTTALALTAFLAALPFTLPNISLPNYLAWLHQAAHHPLGRKLFAMNLAADAILLTPIVLFTAWLYLADPSATRDSLRRHWPLLALFALSILGSTLTGSKIGAGRSHLNGTFLIAAYLAAMIWTRRPSTPAPQIFRFATILCAVFLVIPAFSQLNDMRSICLARRSWAIAVNADIQHILTTHPHQTIELTYNEAPDLADPVDALTNFRTSLVFAGSPITVDAAALSDMGLANLAIPAATTAAIASCHTQLWLVPRSGDPFSVTNLYVVAAPARFPDPQLFPAELRAAFAAHYSKTSTSAFYDLYTCTNP